MDSAYVDSRSSRTRVANDPSALTITENAPTRAEVIRVGQVG